MLQDKRSHHNEKPAHSNYRVAPALNNSRNAHTAVAPPPPAKKKSTVLPLKWQQKPLWLLTEKNKNKKQKAQGAAESCGQDLGDQKNAGLPETCPDRPPLTSRDALHLKSSVHGAP